LRAAAKVIIREFHIQADTLIGVVLPTKTVTRELRLLGPVKTGNEPD